MAVSFIIIILITTTLTLTSKIYHLDEKNYPTYDCIKMEYHNLWKFMWKYQEIYDTWRLFFVHM
jgi:hypothetical protein